MRYLDRRILLDLFIPPRLVLEANYGTRSEQQTHAEIGYSVMEAIDKQITIAFNNQIINQMLFKNYGPNAMGTVRFVSPPVADINKSFKQELLKEAEMLNELLDVKKLMETLDVPTIETTGVTIDRSIDKLTQGTIMPERPDITSPPPPVNSGLVGVQNVLPK